ncbi:glutamate racemase [Brevibacterium casei]|uniref:Glutamate racemase n=1 Tax=Brevibacterium casei TaxID=33889 RepID=A0A269ZHZ2_9MICO|nr:aspartate/glutamate racemase family protein [Brevibacterium casei]MCT1548941.1 aspartate/glutamate racemase family protein [Brevibacterium casei]MCT1561064.1 aspartate/glutamate racemase family protein [Brevibacterium casei]MCT2207449.1 aspartate/glutamate racemase family protein [Brevibacterium casei]PAK97201.1 glutamate racemase [Brevibacterium casei]QPS34753.1 aspartate/glutamate racemase family protein [Brevibacterium casei]
MTRIGLLDSGLGLLGTADALFHLAPHADLVLAMDPDHTPYGSLSPQDLEERVLTSAALLAEWEPDAIVIACNTASVQALEAVRARYEPAIPVIGTVPAVKMAAGTGQDFAVWATPATTGSSYQRTLIETFAGDLSVAQIACPGLAEAINAADVTTIDAAIEAALSQMDPGMETIVLGCTHYGLVADRITAARAGAVTLFDSPVPVAKQTLRRIGLEPGGQAAPASHQAPGDSAPGGAGTEGDDGTEGRLGEILATFASGRRVRLPAELAAYPAGRRLLARERQES